MNLYRELQIEELELQIMRSRNKVADFMQDRSELFLLQFNGGNTGSSFNIAREQIPVGYRHVLTQLISYCEAKEMILNGEKIYTQMLRTDYV